MKATGTGQRIYMQSEINIRVGSKSPKEYLAGVKAQCNGEELQFGRIDSRDALLANLRLRLNALHRAPGALRRRTGDDGNGKMCRKFFQRRRVLPRVLPAGPAKAGHGHLVETAIRLGLVGPGDVADWRTRLVRQA